MPFLTYSRRSSAQCEAHAAAASHKHFAYLLNGGSETKCMVVGRFFNLTLVDTALIASLLLIIMLSGYDNFASKINVRDREDRPAWMGKVGFADLKIKLMGAVVAISAVELLKAFVDIEKFTNEQVAWRVGNTLHW
jgi:uncharacterized protein (TIGR00645 family)